MNAQVTSIEPAGPDETHLAVQIEFSDAGEDYPRSAGIEVWIEKEATTGLTLQEIENLAAAEAYGLLEDILGTRSKGI